jgi:hypothetical protein
LLLLAAKALAVFAILMSADDIMRRSFRCQIVTAEAAGCHVLAALSYDRAATGG